MNKRYLLGIILTTAILVANQLFIQYWLSKKNHDSNIINIAGRQRMLSQKINLAFYQWHQSKVKPITLNTDFTQWQNTHQSFFSGNEASKIELETALVMLKGLNNHFSYIQTQILENDTPQLEHLKKIDSYQADFLVTMDQVVNTLSIESHKKLRFIQWIEVLLMLFSLVIIALEIKYIFMPISLKLKKALDSFKTTNSKLEASLNTIETQNNELKQYTFIAAHDLQEPLHTITTYSNILKQKENNETTKNEEKQQFLEFINSASKRMQNLVKGLLDLSLVGKNAEKTRVDLNELMHEIKERLIDPTASNIKIQFHNLPQVVGHRYELKQLFFHLATNAIKFNSKAEDLIIDVTYIDKGNEYKFTFKDNGVGFSEQYNEKVFKIFQRLHMQDEISGTGIGLALCQKIVHLHGGKIWVENNNETGGVFIFTLKK